MSYADAFHWFVYGHIAFGALGLVAFWLPVVGKKGGLIHRYAGRVFGVTMLATGCFAILISSTTLIAPIETHPHLVAHPDFGSAASIRAIFGWMMLYLAILTVTLAWYGWQSVLVRGDRARLRDWRNLGLHAVLFIASLNTAVRGVLIGQPLMIGISTIGFATVATDLWYLYKPTPRPLDWLLEHIKALVGTGISVYTAFLAFGAVRLLPEAALTPALWSVPLIIGLALILYHQRQVTKRMPKRTQSRSEADAQDKVGTRAPLTS